MQKKIAAIVFAVLMVFGTMAVSAAESYEGHEHAETRAINECPMCLTGRMVEDYPGGPRHCNKCEFGVAAVTVAAIKCPVCGIGVMVISPDGSSYQCDYYYCRYGWTIV